MINILTSLNKTIIAGVILTLCFLGYYFSLNNSFDIYFNTNNWSLQWYKGCGKYIEQRGNY